MATDLTTICARMTPENDAYICTFIHVCDWLSIRSFLRGAEFHMFVEFSSQFILYISTALSCTCGVSLEAADLLSIEPIGVTTDLYTRK